MPFCGVRDTVRLEPGVPSHLAGEDAMVRPTNAIRTHTCEMTVGIADSSSVKPL